MALEIYFILGTKFSWNEGTDTCFNAECVLLGRNFDIFGGYLVGTARYLLVTARYWSFLHLVWTIGNISPVSLRKVLKVHSKAYWN